MPNDSGAPDELEKLVNELGLTSAPSDLATLRSEVKARISELHPDHKSADPKARLLLLGKVLKKTGKGATALQKTANNSQLARVASRAALFPEETVEARLDAVGASQQIVRSRAFLIPKLSLGGLTALLTWTFLFPKTFMDHPFVGRMLKGSHAVSIWLLAIALLVVAWISVWCLEQRKRWYSDQILSLDYQKHTMDSVARAGSVCFSASKFRENLCSRYKLYPRWFRWLVGKLRLKSFYSYYTSPVYDALLVEKAAELAIERFVQKGWIVHTERPEDETDVDDWYKIV